MLHKIEEHLWEKIAEQMLNKRVTL
jgi:hypothetical protein